MKLVRWIVVVTSLLTIVAPAFAADFEFEAQIRARTEYDARDFDKNTASQLFTLQRTRLGATIKSGKITGFIQLQDARIWGSEASTLADATADRFDLHQGYMKFETLWNETTSLRVGRMEINRGNQRLVGAVGWSNTGRSFDGLDMKIKRSNLTLDVWVTSLRDSSNFFSTGGRDIDSYFAGAYGTYNWTNEFNKTEAFLMYDIDRDTLDAGPDVGDSRLSRYTVGANHFYTGTQLQSSVEFAYQFGKMAENDSVKVDISAYFFSIRGAYEFAQLPWSPLLGVGLDWLSGNDVDDASSFGAFNTLFATNHKFYGYMDYFPVLAGELGLRDYFVRVKGKPSAKTFLVVDFHYFERDQKDAAGESLFGYETDFTGKYTYNTNFSLQAGYSFFIPKEVFKTAGRNDTAHWFYLMATANL